MDKEKPGLAILVKGMLKKKGGDKEEASNEEEDSEASPVRGIAEDIIAAVKDDDADTLVEAIDALYTHWSSPKKEDCGCKDKN